MWWILLIYFALNIIITAISFVINWNFQEWTAKDIISIVAMVLFGVPILVFGLIYCYILQIGREMTAGRRDVLHQKPTDFAAERFQRGGVHIPQLLCGRKMIFVAHFFFFLETRCLQRQISFAAP